MSSPSSRRRERRLALRGDFPDTGESVTEILGRARPADWDARAYKVTGAAGMLPPGPHPDQDAVPPAMPRGIASYQPGDFRPGAGIVTFERVTGPLAILSEHGAQPGMFPALPPAPQPPPVLAAVPVTEPAVIGDALRLPVMWCEAAACIAWHYDPASAGEADSRARAIAAGWRTDAFGRLMCPACQQSDPGFRATQPVAWHHLEVARSWREDGTDLDGDAKDRLAATAEYARRIIREDPALARDLAAATERHARRTAGGGRHGRRAAGAR